MKPFLPSSLVFAGVIFVSLTPAHANTWTGATSASWNDDTNWSTAAKPGAADVVTFDAASTANLATTLDAAFSIQGLSVTSPGANVSIARGTGGSLSLGADGIDLGTATQNLSFSLPPTLLEDQSWTIGAGRTLGISLPSNTTFPLGSKTLTKSGGGALTLSGTNLSSGTLRLDGGSTTMSGYSSIAIGVAATATVEVATGATFDIIRSSGNFTLSGTIRLDGGAWRFVAGSTNASTLNGQLNVTAAGGILQLSNNSGGAFNLAVGSAITGSGPLDIRNLSSVGSPIILSGDNSGFTGTVNANGTSGARVLRINNANAGSAAATWNIATGNTLQVAGVAISLGDLTGPGNVTTNTGAGTLTVGAKNNTSTYGGVISGNTSLVKTGSGDWTLTGNQTYTGTTTVNDGSLTAGSLSPSTAVTLAGGDLGLGTATAAANTTVASLTQSDGDLKLDVVAGTLDHLTVTGDYDHTGGGIAVKVGDTPPLDTPYPLVTYNGNLTANPPVTFSGLGSSRITGFVDYGTGTNSAITVTFSTANLTWNGTDGGVWNLDDTQNWLNNGSPDKFLQFDKVIFDDNGSGGTVLLSGSLTPSVVAFNNTTQSYVLAGDGSLTGSTSIVKSGTGFAAVATDNTHTGVTKINEGTLGVGNGGTTGTLGSGNVENNGALIFNRSDIFTFPNLVSGFGALVQAGSGTTILTANNTYAGTTTVDAGTLQIGAGGTVGSLGTGTVVTNATLAFNRSDTVSLPGELGGTGGLTQMGPGTLVLEADETYTGPTLISGGRLQLGNGGTTGTIYSSESITNNGELAINHSASLDFPQVITGTGGVIHAGTETLRLTGANTYAGGTYVSGGGTLAIDATAGIPLATAAGFQGTGGTITIDPAYPVFAPSALIAGSGSQGVILGASSVLSVGDTPLVLNKTTANGATNLDLSGLAAYVHTAPSSALTLIDGNSARGASATLTLSPSNTLTFASALIGSSGFPEDGIATANLVLGATNTLNVNTISVGSGKSTASIAFPTTGTPSLTLRAADGTGRTNLTAGSNTSNYKPANGTLNFAGGSTDALLGTVLLGVSTAGSQNATGTIHLGAGVFDATEIVLGRHAGTAAAVATGIVNTGAGTLQAGTITFGDQLGSGGIPAATLALDNGGTLAATTLQAGAGAATRNLNWISGTLANLPGSGLTVTGIPLNIPANGSSRTLSIEAGQSATFGTGSSLAFDYDSSLLTSGTLTVSGNLVLGAGAALALRDTAATPVPLAIGTKLTLLRYSAGTVTGTFSGLPDGAHVTVGAQPFVIDYDDTSGGSPAVTLTAAVAVADPFVGWIDSFTALTDPADKTRDADPDHDGLNNLAEFAFNSDPTNPSGAGDRTRMAIGDVAGENALTLTVAMRAGAAADPADPENGELVFVKDGVTYRIQGSGDLSAWTKDIGEVTPNTPFIGTLTTPDEGWEYRTFRANGAVSDAPSTFLRVKLESEP